MEAGTATIAVRARAVAVAVFRPQAPVAVAQTEGRLGARNLRLEAQHPQQARLRESRDIPAEVVAGHPLPVARARVAKAVVPYGEEPVAGVVAAHPARAVMAAHPFMAAGEAEAAADRGHHPAESPSMAETEEHKPQPERHLAVVAGETLPARGASAGLL
jgi:hypothetical protein